MTVANWRKETALRVSRYDWDKIIEDVGRRTIEIELDPCLKVEEFKGSDDPICGWVSRGYHQKEASTTVVGRCSGEGNTCLVCRIDIGELKQAAK